MSTILTDIRTFISSVCMFFNSWQLREIARKSGDSVANVARIRKSLVAENPVIAAPVRMVQRGGKKYPMKVDAIGQKKAPRKAPTGNAVKEDVVNEPVTTSAQPSIDPVVPAAATEPENKPEQEQADKNDDLTDAIDAQVVGASTVKSNEAQVPPTATPNATPQRYGDRFEVVLGSKTSFENSEGIFIVFGNKKALMLDLIRDTCVENDATVFATRVAAVAWKLQNMTEDERQAMEEIAILHN